MGKEKSGVKVKNGERGIWLTSLTPTHIEGPGRWLLHLKLFDLTFAIPAIPQASFLRCNPCVCACVRESGCMGGWEALWCSALWCCVVGGCVLAG